MPEPSPQVLRAPLGELQQMQWYPDPADRVTIPGERIPMGCPRCDAENVILVELGSEADLVRCESCGFTFGCEQGPV